MKRNGNPRKRVLRFAVSSALVATPLATGCGGQEQEPTINEPAPQHTNEPAPTHVNEVEPEPETTSNEPAPEQDRPVHVNEAPPVIEEEPAAE